MTAGRPSARGRGALLAIAMGLLVGTTGCGDDTGGGGDTLVEIGTGTIEFEAFSANPSLDVIAGPQGGHHFIVHARAQNIIPGDASIPGLQANPRTIFQAFTETGTQIDLMFPPYTLGYRRDGSWFVLPSGRILQIEDDVVSTIIGQQVRLTVQVTDADGKRANDEVWVQVTEGPLPDNDAGVADAGIIDAGVDAAAPDAASSL